MNTWVGVIGASPLILAVVIAVGGIIWEVWKRRNRG